ncbi:MAG: two-component system, chemotaxis family, protein-glutamate methylesterase/glutaminase [Micromonosporaceae bacterium]
MTKIRVLVVEDSPTVRDRIREILSADPDLDVTAVAKDGAQAIELCRRIRPDVITMDMSLPVLSGLAATEYIMAHCPTPILIVSSSTNRSELFNTYDALRAGAVDVLDKPPGDALDGTWEHRLRASVKLVSRIAVITHPRARHAPAPPVHPIAPNGGCRAVAIGASTGGPSAVVDVLRALPAGYPIPVLLVQHIGAPFAAAFADWLAAQTGLPTSYARDGQPLDEAAGHVVVAPPDRHLIVRGHRLYLTDDAEQHSCRPSIDVLFTSMAHACGSACAACLLTGMGRDGAAGLLLLRQTGARTLTQDEQTSVVYGMPREAALLGAAQEILPPREIGRRLAGLTPLPSPAAWP